MVPFTVAAQPKARFVPQSQRRIFRACVGWEPPHLQSCNKPASTRNADDPMRWIPWPKLRTQVGAIEWIDVARGTCQAANMGAAHPSFLAIAVASRCAETGASI